ncbi:MAG: hypothetical protein PHI63_02705 [Patescibacteria group bacterium]|nr:hypothetical protein [Patescibacteria group bacterium]
MKTDLGKILKFIVLVVVALVALWVGTGMLAAWPIPTAIAVAFATFMLTGKQANLFGKTISTVWLVVVWAAGFLLFQSVAGAAFGIQLGQLYDKIGDRGILVLLVDPGYLGQAFLAQAAALALSGILAWKFASWGHRNRLLWPAAIICIVYLLFSVNESWRLTFGSYVGAGDGKLHLTSTRLDLRRQLDDALAEMPPKMVVPVDGIPLYEYSTVTVPKKGVAVKQTVQVPEVAKGSEYYVYLDRKVQHVDDRVWYVPVKNVRDSKQIGMFNLADVKLFIEKGLDDLEKAKHKAEPPARPPAVVAPVSLPPAPPAPSPIAPAAVKAAPKSTVTKDTVTVTKTGVDWQPTKVVGYPGDTIVVTPKSGLMADVSRLKIRVGGAAEVTLQPAFVYGNWAGHLECAGLPNPLNQPILLQLVENGSPIAVVVEKR